ncbi:hypothetical protein QCA50_018259 [Cerrena zonata]|uniref:Uncharacterized protein n=1 Tax=Cerrena zonata TaxID=2478898 RepID=A0AAW0FH82_9APHY
MEKHTQTQTDISAGINSAVYPMIAMGRTSTGLSAQRDMTNRQVGNSRGLKVHRLAWNNVRSSLRQKFICG